MQMRVVHKIRDFNGVTQGDAANPREAERLEGAGIKTIDDLWDCVGVNFDTGIAKVSEEAPVDSELLFALLIADAVGDSRHRAEGEPFRFKSIPKRLWLRLKRAWHAPGRKWLETFLAVATLLLAAFAFRAGYVNPGTAEQVVVKSPSGLMPFQGVRPDGVALKRVPREPGSFTSTQQVAGRYPLRPIPADTTLREDQFMNPELTAAMKGRKLLSLPVNARALDPTTEIPARVRLLLSPRAAGEKEAQPVFLGDVILLSVKKEGDTASIEVALTDDSLKEVGAVLAESEVYLLRAAD